MSFLEEAWLHIVDALQYSQCRNVFKKDWYCILPKSGLFSGIWVVCNISLFWKRFDIASTHRWRIFSAEVCGSCRVEQQDQTWAMRKGRHVRNTTGEKKRNNYKSYYWTRKSGRGRRSDLAQSYSYSRTPPASRRSARSVSLADYGALAELARNRNCPSPELPHTLT